jgi:hypothetical protein
MTIANLIKRSLADDHTIDGRLRGIDTIEPSQVFMRAVGGKKQMVSVALKPLYGSNVNGRIDLLTE